MAAVDSYRKYIYLSNNNYVESGFGHVLENLKFDFSVRVLVIVLEFNSVFSKRIVVKMLLFCPYLGIKSCRELSIFGRSATSGNYPDAIETRTAAERFVDMHIRLLTPSVNVCMHIAYIKHAQKHDIIHAHTEVSQNAMCNTSFIIALFCTQGGARE